MPTDIPTDVSTELQVVPFSPVVIRLAFHEWFCNYKDIEKLMIGLKDVFLYRKYSLFLSVVLKYL